MTLPLVGVDFETRAIQRRPAYPPEPVGVAISEAGGRRGAAYHAWGHPTDNNCSFSQGRAIVRDLWRRAARREIQLVFFNEKFDLDVAETHLGVSRLPWDATHDPMFLAFLFNPYERYLGLKPLAEQHLGAAHNARNVLQDWIQENVPEARRARSKWGAYISEAPGSLARPYAIDDVIETVALHRFFVKKLLDDDGVRGAYDRERRLVYPLLDAERRGVRINADRLATDLELWERSRDIIDRWLRRRLGAPNLVVDSDPDLREALDRSGVMQGWLYTEPSKTFPGGQPSVAVDSLEYGLANNRPLLDVFRYRAKLVNGLQTFGRPWLEMAAHDGRIFTTWNQVRQDQNDQRQIGARTGRLSSTPNFQNIAKSPGVLTYSLADFRREVKRSDDTGSVRPLLLPKALSSVSPLPDLRGYVVPFRKGDEINVRDFDQQELRILAHFEGDELMRAYINNPALDQHSFARSQINARLGTAYTRKHIKNTGFGIIYAMGLKLLAEKIEASVETARAVRQAYRQIFPGLDDLERDLKRRGRQGLPIRTHGGRIYYPEEAKIIKGRLRTFEYKFINTLIQGSASDAMKETIIAYDELGGDGTWHLTAHDELVTSAPKRARRAEQERIRTAMVAMRFDVPMTSSGAYGPTWSSHDLTRYEGDEG